MVVAQLVHAANRGDLTLFEYLIERGAGNALESAKEAISVNDMLQHRQNWINLATLLAQRLPLPAIRIIHEYTVGFNWSAVHKALPLWDFQAASVSIKSDKKSGCHELSWKKSRLQIQTWKDQVSNGWLERKLHDH